MTAMRIRRALLTLVAGVTLVGGCADLDVTNPNQQNSETFWRTEADATRGLAAAYNGLYLLGTFSRWHIFANDIRSDIGTAEATPWGDLGQFNAFRLNDYNFEVNRHLWVHNFELVGRANQVIANVPAIDMDAAMRDRYVGEAKFLRALAYYNLVTLYENVPLITAPLAPEERPASAAPAETFAQIERDLVDAAAVLPDPDEEAALPGHATKWAALAMLGRVRLQMAGVLDQAAKWGEAADALEDVIQSGDYGLAGNYEDNFREGMAREESIFEVENEDLWPVGVTGASFPKMIGPCYRPGNPRGAGVPSEYNPTWCDARPTRWYFEQFMASRTTGGEVDPRADVTLLYDRPDRATENVFGRERGSYFIDNPLSEQREDTMLFFRKYGEHFLESEQRWDNPINYRVLRYADVLLMQAEALNESNQTGAALPFINLVRARVQKSALAGLSQAQLRDTILYERMFELGLEASRFNDLRRHDRLSSALSARDNDFLNFEAGKSERLPIPTTETNLNPNVRQNPGW
jgi:hypothetical protein